MNEPTKIKQKKLNNPPISQQTGLIVAATRPYCLLKINSQQEKVHLLVVFSIVLLLYAITTPRLIAMEDDGLFISNLEFFGVAHPPGYPIHTFLGGIFYHLLPFGTPAFKGHFFSGFVGAIACCAIYIIVRMLIQERAFAYLAGISYGASKTFWSQAIIAEVYTLNAMFFFIILALCIKYASNEEYSKRRRTCLLYVITFIYGVAMANHYPILFLGSTGLGLLVLSQYRHILTNIPKLIIIIALGVAPPYVWMVVRSYDLTPANFYGSIETWEQFVFYVTRSGYSSIDKQADIGLSDKITFIKFLSNEMLWQFTPIGFVLIVVGFIVMSRSRYNWLWLSLTISWVTSSFLLIYLLDFKSSFLELAIFRVYHLLAYGIMAIWLAFGASWIVNKIRFLPNIVYRQMGSIITILIFGSIVITHWEINNRRDYRWAHDYAMIKINSIERNAILFTSDDLDIPLGYLHYVEGIRPDLNIYNDQGLIYGNRLYPPLIPDHPPKNKPNSPNKARVLRQLMNETYRPIYYNPSRLDLFKHPQYGSDFLGFFHRVNRQGPQNRIALSDSLRQWLNNNIGISDSITDLWTKQQHYNSFIYALNTVLVAGEQGFKFDKQWLDIIEKARLENASTRMITTDVYLFSNQFTKQQIEKEIVWMNSHDIESDRLMLPEGKSLFYSILAKLIERLHGKDHPSYENSLLKGIKQLESNKNKALPLLLSLYFQKNRHCDFINLINRFYPQPDDIPKTLLHQFNQIQEKFDCSKEKIKSQNG